jgi:hypothetical protein
MAVIHKQRRELSDTQETLSTQPQVLHVAGEHMQGKVSLCHDLRLCRGQNNKDFLLCFTFCSY